MRQLHFDRRFFIKHHTKWVSFESDPKLERTKKDIYRKCVPCILNLYEQLKERKQEIDLGQAYNCWKVVVVVENIDACIDLLAEYERVFLRDRWIKGRFGSGDEKKRTKVIVINAEDELEKDRLMEELKICVENAGVWALITSHKGCAELYHGLFGDWREWKRISTIKNPNIIPDILNRIREMLYWKDKK